MRPCHLIRLLAVLTVSTCCVPGVQAPALPIETGFSIVNLSKTFYLTVGLREHGSAAAYFVSPLLAPGGTSRIAFVDAIHAACPASVDLRVFLYRRVNQTTPIGADEAELVESTPAVAGEIENIPACSVETLETYTIVNWDAPDGTARVKIAQCSNVDAAIRTTGIFNNNDNVWEVNGVDARLLNSAVPDHAVVSPITGRVIKANGAGLGGVLVLVRSRFRTRLDCADPDNAADSGYSDPIAFTVSDETGAFSIDRPAGVYRLEFFSDDVAFRPGLMDIETPLDDITVLAEPL